MLVWVQFPQWERKHYIKRVVCYIERKTIMLIEDIDVSTDPEITLACAKCHAENGFKTETVFTDMEQLNGLVDEDVFSILHLGLPCPHGGDATEDIVTIESTCAPEHIAEYYQYYAKYALGFNDVVEMLKTEYALEWDMDIARFVALVAIDRDIPEGIGYAKRGEYLSQPETILEDFCCVHDSAFNYLYEDIWLTHLNEVPEDVRPYVDVSKYVEDLAEYFYEVDIPARHLVAIFSN